VLPNVLKFLNFGFGHKNTLPKGMTFPVFGQILFKGASKNSKPIMPMPRFYPVTAVGGFCFPHF
jgi:hypothetical protein